MDMQNNSSNRVDLSPLAYAPLCPSCAAPMRIAAAQFTARKREISFVCKGCATQRTESSPDLQG